MKIQNRYIYIYIYIGILLLFSAFSFITSSQITSHAATSVISEGYSADKSVKWTVTDDGTMTIAPTNGKEGTLTFGRTLPELNWPFLDIYYQPEDGDPISTYEQNPLARKIKKIIANTGTIHVNDCFNLFINAEQTAKDFRGWSYSTKLTYVDITSFDTSQCTNFRGMFANQTKLEIVKTGSTFRGTNSKTCVFMFDNCYSMRELNLAYFDTPKCIDFTLMLGVMPHLEELNLQALNTTAAINLALSNNDPFHAQWVSMNSFVIDTTNEVNDDGSVYFAQSKYTQTWDSLKKVTFGDKCIGKPQVTYSVEGGTGTQTNDIGIPYCMGHAMSIRNYKSRGNADGSDSYIENTWTKSDGQYKNLTFKDIKDKYSNDPSFKLAGTWLRDDALPQYNVTFKDGYMKNTISTKSVSEGSNIAKSDFPSVKSYASDGIKFDGWFDESNRECTSGYTNVTKNMTLTARYRPYRITAKFICDDGSEAHIDMNTAYRTKITMPKYTGKVPTGKIFAMWSIKQLDGNTKLLHEDETIDVPVLVKCPTDDSGTITFKAVFTAVNNPDTNQNANQADTPASVPDTNENVPVAPSPEPKNEQASTPVAPQPAAQQASELIQTGVEILHAALAASAASIAAILIRKRTK